MRKRGSRALGGLHNRLGGPHVLRIVVEGLGDQRAAERKVRAVHEARYYRTQSETEKVLPLPVEQQHWVCIGFGETLGCGEVHARFTVTERREAAGGPSVDASRALSAAQSDMLAHKLRAWQHAELVSADRIHESLTHTLDEIPAL